MSAVRAALEEARFTSVKPRLLRNESLNVWWLLNGSVLVPIQTVMSLSSVTESRKAWLITTGPANSNST